MPGLKNMNPMGDITFGKAWEDGGPLMWVLAFFSIMALTVMLYLWLTQRKSSFVERNIKRIISAKDPEAEGARIAERVYAAVDWLSDIAAIAPLVGIATDVAAGAKPVVLAQGVSQAIVTTIFGLVIAIPSLLMHAIFRRRAARLVAALEEKADEVLG